MTSTGDSDGDGYYERDAQLQIALDGTWWLTYSKSQTSFTHGGNPDDLKYDVYVKSSSDGGVSWSAETKVLDAAAIHADSSFRSSTICEADGKIWVIGADVRGLEGDIWATTYSSGTWSGEAMIFDGTYSTGAFHVDSVAEGNDIRLFYGIQDETQGVGFIKYHGGTDTWDSTVTKIDASAGYQIPRVLKTGNTYYMVSTDWSHILFTKTTTPDTVPWPTASYMLNAPSGGAASDPTVLKYGDSDGSDDLVVFAAPWYSDDSQPIEYVYSTDAGATWSSPIPFTDAAHGSQVSWDMMPRAYLKDTSTIMLFYSMEQRDVSRGQGDIVVCEWDISSAIGNKHYTTIQDGIGEAVTGDNVNVAAGPYNENLLLSKSLRLTGAQAGVPACGRTASELVVTPANPLAMTLELQTGSAGSIIDGFTFSGGSISIGSTTGPIDNLQLLNNRIVGFTVSGVFLNDNGVDITVSQNLIDGSSKTGAGDLFHLDQDNFDGFQFTNNCVLNGATANGFFVDGNHNVGVSATRSPLFNNNLIDNCQVGANLGRYAFEYGTISGNTFSNNAYDGLQGGIQHSLITGNTFLNNGRHGLALTGFSSSVSSDPTRGAQINEIIGNTFTGNGFTRNGSAIFYNRFQYAGTISTNIAHDNNICGNNYGALYEGTETIDATENFWGTSSGPTHPSNPGGTGDRVTDNISFNPWLNVPYGDPEACGLLPHEPTAVGGNLTPTNTLAWAAPWLILLVMAGCIGTVVAVAKKYQ